MASLFKIEKKKIFPSLLFAVFCHLLRQKQSNFFFLAKWISKRVIIFLIIFFGFPNWQPVWGLVWILLSHYPLNLKKCFRAMIFRDELWIPSHLAFFKITNICHEPSSIIQSLAPKNSELLSEIYFTIFKFFMKYFGCNIVKQWKQY